MEKKPDWNHWCNMETVSLGEAVLLSLGDDPINSGVHCEVMGFFTSDYVRAAPDSPEMMRYNLARSSFEQNGFQWRSPYKDGIPEAMPCVSLSEFGAWLVRKGFKIPEKFPTAIATPSRRTPGGITVDLPYPCEFISKLIRVINDNYANLRPGEKPNQKKAGLELDKLVGWTNEIKDEKASKSAAQIVAQLRPTDI